MINFDEIFDGAKFNCPNCKKDSSLIEYEGYSFDCCNSESLIFHSNCIIYSKYGCLLHRGWFNKELGAKFSILNEISSLNTQETIDYFYNFCNKYMENSIFE